MSGGVCIAVMLEGDDDCMVVRCEVDTLIDETIMLG